MIFVSLTQKFFKQTAIRCGEIIKKVNGQQRGYKITLNSNEFAVLFRAVTEGLARKGISSI